MKIKSKEHALKVIIYVSKVFVVLGLFQAVASFWLFQLLADKLFGLVLGIIYVLLGSLLWKFKKVIFAYLLIFITSVSVLLMILNLFGLMGSGENRGLPIIGIAMIFAGFQGLKSIKYYNNS